MTEFYDLGAHCAKPDCHEKDFLPFECNACHKKFCLEHRSYQAHQCENENMGDRTLPICPLCNQAIPIRPNEDPNKLVDYHIQQGCPKVGKTIAERSGKKVVYTGPRCPVKDCGKKANVTCKGCGVIHCVAHRNEMDHNCSEALLDKNQTSFFSMKPTPVSKPVKKPKPAPIPSKSVNQVLGELHKARATRGVIPPPVIDLTKDEKPTVAPPKPTIPTNSNYQQKSKQLAKQFSNSKFKAIGQSSIETPDRFHLDIYFPLQSHTPPVHMFFNKSNKVGKVLDLVAKQGKLNNPNATEQDANKRINLFNVSTGYCLPTSKELQELAKEGLLNNHDGVIVEVGQEIDVQRVEQAAQDVIKHPDDNSMCSVM